MRRLNSKILRSKSRKRWGRKADKDDPSQGSNIVNILATEGGSVLAPESGGSCKHAVNSEDILSITDPGKRLSIYWEKAYETLADKHKTELRKLDLSNLNQQFEELKKLTTTIPAVVDGQTHRPFMTRGRFLNILKNIQRYSSVFGSTDIAIGQFTQVISLVWSGVNFALELALKDLKTFDDISNALEEVTAVICSCERHDRIFFSQTGRDLALAEKVLNSIPPIYATCLEFTAEALIYVRRHAAERLVVGAINRFESYPQPLIHKLTGQRMDLEKLAAEAQQSTASEMLKHLEDNKRREILYWLSKVTPVDHHELARRNRALCSGKWLFEQAQFQSWFEDSESSVLWLYGIAGSGKTVLSSAIIDSLSGTCQRNPILYFYSNYQEKDRQQRESVIRTLYRDLVARGGPTRDYHLAPCF